MILPRTGAYAPSATCKHGIHPFDCTQGCNPNEPRDDVALEKWLAECERIILAQARALGFPIDEYTVRLEWVRKRGT